MRQPFRPGKIVARLGDGRQAAGDALPGVALVVAGVHLAGGVGGEQGEACGMAGQGHGLDVVAHVSGQAISHLAPGARAVVAADDARVGIVGRARGGRRIGSTRHEQLAFVRREQQPVGVADAEGAVSEALPALAGIGAVVQAL